MTLTKNLKQAEFYFFLFVGLLMLVQTVLFAIWGDHLTALACLMVAVASPGLMPVEKYTVPLGSPNAFIRAFALWGSQLTSFCRLLCLLAVVIFFTQLK